MTATRQRKPATEKKPVEAAPETEAEVPDANPVGTFRKRELIERVTAETGLRRRDVKAVTEALLSAMGDAVREGQTLALEPMGKLRVARSNETGGRRVLTCKLRQKSAALAEPVD